MAKKGAPIKYKEDYARQAKIACAEGGFTDAKLAKLFDVAKRTIATWKNDIPDFLHSVKEGKEQFDTENVEKALLKRALGFQYNEITKEPENPDSEAKDTGLVVTKIVRKSVPGDVKAQTFWLRNRNRERWPDSQNVNGNLSLTMTHEEMLDELE